MGWKFTKVTPEDAQVCTLCGACEDQCTQHLPIWERLHEIAAINQKRTG